MQFTTKELFAYLITSTFALIAAFYRLFSETTKKDVTHLNEKIEDVHERIDKLDAKLERILEKK